MLIATIGTECHDCIAELLRSGVRDIHKDTPIRKALSSQKWVVIKHPPITRPLNGQRFAVYNSLMLPVAGVGMKRELLL